VRAGRIGIRMEVYAHLFVEMCPSVSMGRFEVPDELLDQFVIAVAILFQQKVTVVASLTWIVGKPTTERLGRRRAGV
jgi:hypothetical protein